MAIVRFGDDSDIYIYERMKSATEDGVFVCCQCRFLEDDDFIMYTREQIERHVHEHSDAGHDVPDYVLERNERDIKAYGNYPEVYNKKVRKNRGALKGRALKRFKMLER